MTDLLSSLVTVIWILGCTVMAILLAFDKWQPDERTTLKLVLFLSLLLQADMNGHILVERTQRRTPDVQTPAPDTEPAVRVDACRPAYAHQ